MDEKLLAIIFQIIDVTSSAKSNYMEAMVAALHALWLRGGRSVYLTPCRRIYLDENVLFSEANRMEWGNRYRKKR